MLGGAAIASPLVARAQQQKNIVGYVTSASSDYSERVALPAVREGLKEIGFVEKQNLVIEFRAADGHYDRIPELVADLIERKVAVILASGGSASAFAAKVATATIPIVFVTAADPLGDGLVASLNRPGGNVTGFSLVGVALEPKRLELLQQLAPGPAFIGALVNPNYPDADLQRRDLKGAAQAINRSLEIVDASTVSHIDAAVAALAQHGAGALIVAADPFFLSRREQIVTLAARYRLPAIYAWREFPEIGGLASYGTNIADGFRQAGIMVGKILNGASPADLPVMQPTKFELVVNLKTAKALGIEISPNLLAQADEVIE
ncbi:MAG TPA: ABC transporter substrate-binding protein [Stellaceae bacterium]|nr:ABC transporter substrate-binding protein [Stellaceae bacterium]